MTRNGNAAAAQNSAESKFNRRRRSATSARSAAISARSEAIKSATSAGISIPPLIQIRAALSAKTTKPKPNLPTLWPLGLTPAWELQKGFFLRLTH